MPTTSNTYRNPFLQGYNPDPSLVYVEGKGYFCATSTFEFFPGIPIWHSTDLVAWKLIGHALNRRSQGVDMRTNEADSGLWAPTLRYHKGRFFMVNTCFYRLTIVGGSREQYVPPTGFVVSTDNIFDDAAWSDATYFEEQGFDQDLFFDDDDRVYLTTTRFELGPEGFKNILIASFSNEIDIKTGRSLTEPVVALRSEHGVAEGCHILKKDGWYYLFSAEGGTHEGHREGVYRSQMPLGPYEAPPAGVNPIIFNDMHPDIRNTGHADLIEGADGQWWAVFLGVRPVQPRGTGKTVEYMTSQLGRQSFIAPVEWVDGWPVVNGGKPTELVGQATGLTYKEEQQSWIADFSGKDLELGWYSLRTPLRKCYDLLERPGSLAIRGSGYTLDIDESPAMLVRKQPDFNVDWSTEVEFDPRKVGEEAGTVAWVAKEAYGALLLRRSAGDEKVNEVVFRTCARGNDDDEKPVDKASFSLAPGVNTVTLLIKARTKRYDFFFKAPGAADFTLAGSLAATVLLPLFTGTQFGLFAQGAEGRPCLNSAFFKYARWALQKE